MSQPSDDDDGRASATFIPGLTPYAQHHLETSSSSTSGVDPKEQRKRERKRRKARQKIPIVTIHGMKGSVLAKPDGQIVWLTGSQAAGLSTPDLALPLKWKNGVQEHDDITAKHTLKAVTVIPYLVGASLYEGWLSKAQLLGCPSYEFSYDWRRSCCENTVKFAAYVRWISAKHDGLKVQVVAHSMGGLITTAAMNLYPELFHSVFFAGVPFKGGPGFLQDMHVGTPNGRNMGILAPKVLWTFPSAQVICHLPGEHDDPNYSGIVDANMKPISVDWYDILDWKKHKFALYSDESQPPTRQEEEAFANALADAKKFRKLVVGQKGVKYPPICVMASDKFPSRKAFIKDGPKSFRGLDFETYPNFPGDGRVPITHATPTGIPHEFVRSDLNHETILNDDRIPDLLQKLVDQVLDQGGSEAIMNPLHHRL